MVSTAAFHAKVRGSVPGLGGVKLSIVGSLRDREVACSASDRQGSNFESCVWRTVSSHSSHHPQEVLLAQFSLYVHKGGLKPDSFHFTRYRPTYCGRDSLIYTSITTSAQHWVHVSCLLGSSYKICETRLFLLHLFCAYCPDDSGVALTLSILCLCFYHLPIYFGFNKNLFCASFFRWLMQFDS